MWLNMRALPVENRSVGEHVGHRKSGDLPRCAPRNVCRAPLDHPI